MRSLAKDIWSQFSKVFPYLLVFLLSLYNPSDPDLGWHLKYGQYFFRTGQILRENIFSLEMPDFKWVNSSWGTDLITYSIYHNFGFFGLTVAAGLTTVLILYIISKVLQLEIFAQIIIFPLLLLVESPVLQVSFRGHLLTLLFIATLLSLLIKYESKNRKLLLLTIPLFLFWANIHGEFILGLIITAVWLLMHNARILLENRLTRKFLKTDWFFSLFILTSCFLTTIIHPYGFSIYREALQFSGSPYLKYILEWNPFDVFSFVWWVLIGWGILLIYSIILLHAQKKLFKYLPQIVVSVMLFLISFWIRRYAWAMYFISIPLIAVIVGKLRPNKKTVRNIFIFVILISLYIYAVIVKIPSLRLTGMSWQRYCDISVNCSVKSAEFLTKYQILGKFLSFYNWGGWLIWNYPQIKPSIDGRMHLWQDAQEYNAFVKYFYLEQNINDIENSDYDVVYMSPAKPLYRRLIELSKENKWTIAYEDEKAGIFVRNK